MTVSLSTEQREELRRLAEAATRSEIEVPGAWHAVEEEASGYWSVNATGDGKTTAIHNHITYGPLEQTHRFIAAASPDVVLALLDALDAGPRSEIEVELLREAMQGAREGQSWTPSAADIAVEYNRLAALRATEETP